jgi:NADPH:quinone reductase-like Zn-dependent oxidoreductase
MRAYELPGESIDSLRRVERPVPRPGPGQVLVRIRAASLNFRDLLIANGTYPRGPTKDRLVPLSDGAGDVVELGPGVTRLKVKDRVMGAFFEKWLDGPFDFNVAMSSARGGSIDGVLAEYVSFDEAAAVHIPEGFSFEEASTLPCAGVTAWVALMELGPVRAGQTLLAMGTGGVSVFAMQLAKLAGASVILTSSHDEKLARGKALGADQAINYRSVPRWDAAARELTFGRGVDHLVEVGGQGTLATSLRAVRSGGRIVLVGQLTGAMADRDTALQNEQGVQIDSVFVGSARQLANLSAGATRLGLRPIIDRVFGFEDALEAYRHLERGAHFGKVVIAL